MKKSGPVKKTEPALKPGQYIDRQEPEVWSEKDLADLKKEPKKKATS